MRNEKDEKIVAENVSEKVMKEGKWEMQDEIRKVSRLITKHGTAPVFLDTKGLRWGKVT